MYDLIIVGAGPAGATLARLAGKRLKTLVLDRRDLEGPVAGTGEKLCGGLLAPDAQEMLARFGLGLPAQVLVSPQLFAVRAIDLITRQQRIYPRNYLNVNRQAMDRWLVSLIPPAVERGWGAQFLGFVQSQEGVEVSFSLGGERQKARTRFLAGADGALSRVRAELGLGFTPPSYTAIQEAFAAKAPSPYFSALFDRKITDFYAWTIPKGDKLLVGAALPRGAAGPAQFAELKGKLQGLGFDLDTSLGREGTMLLRPLGGRGLAWGRGRVALIGEAGGWISPSSAEGISYAFRSALALARALEGNPEGALRRYRALTRALVLNIVAKTAKCPPMYQPFLRRLALGTGLLSIQDI